MIGNPMISRVELKTVAPVAAKNPRRGAIVDQVANVVGVESNRRVSGEWCDLVIDIVPDDSLQRQHVEVILLELVLPDFRRRIDRHPCQREHLRLIRVRWNLKVIDRGAREQAQPRGRIKIVRKVPEPRSLVAGIMNRRGSGRRRLDSAIGAEILPRHVIAEVALCPAILKARLRGPALPAVKIHVGDRVEQPILGLNIDDSCRAEAVLSRERACQQAYRLREAWTEHLPEACYALGKLDPVY